MRTAPDFWWQATPTPAARLLQPFGTVYGALTARRMARPGLALPVPVICVGNLIVGGAGKTPTALALAEVVHGQGHRPAFLSRGYGGDAARTAAERVIRVDPEQHDATAVGDEPLLLAGSAPTYVAADRRRAARAAIADGATILILDDGLQNPALRKTLTLAVVDGATGLGNRLCMPAGPLRAPTPAQWPFVNAVCIIGEGAAGDRVAVEAERLGKPVLRAILEPEPQAIRALRGQPLVAFAGIGRPEKFFATLRSCGLDVRIAQGFPDHHRFSNVDRDALLRMASCESAQLVTTTKDRVRLPPDFPVSALPVRLRFADQTAVDDLVAPLRP